MPTRAVRPLLGALLLFTCLPHVATAQFGPQQILDDALDHAEDVYAADIDGDGDLDVVAAASGARMFVWYENLDGRGSFGARRTIGEFIVAARVVHPADLDGDGDLDVVAAAGSPTVNNTSQILWYENLNRRGTFGARKVITTNTDLPDYVTTADLDADGDLDVLAAAKFANTFTWYENTDGRGTFAAAETLATGGFPVFLGQVDLNEDGAADILTVSAHAGSGAWIERLDGAELFAAPEEVVSFGVYDDLAATLADLDDDGKLDLVLAGGNEVKWRKNGPFASELGHNVFQAPVATKEVREILYDVAAADLDRDGSVDVLVGGTANILWFFNADGAGTLGSTQVITSNINEATAVVAADLDGDGDDDVLSASALDNKIAWYANQHPAVNTEAAEGLPTAYQLRAAYPNPFNPTTQIAFALPEPGPVTLTVYDSLGRVVAMLAEGRYPAGQFTTTWEAEGLPSGLYLYRLEAGSYTATRAAVLLK